MINKQLFNFKSTFSIVLKTADKINDCLWLKWLRSMKIDTMKQAWKKPAMNAIAKQILNDLA